MQENTRLSMKSETLTGIQDRNVNQRHLVWPLCVIYFTRSMTSCEAGTRPITASGQNRPDTLQDQSMPIYASEVTFFHQMTYCFAWSQTVTDSSSSMLLTRDWYAAASLNIISSATSTSFCITLINNARHATQCAEFASVFFVFHHSLSCFFHPCASQSRTIAIYPIMHCLIPVTF